MNCSTGNAVLKPPTGVAVCGDVEVTVKDDEDAVDVGKELLLIVLGKFELTNGDALEDANEVADAVEDAPAGELS